MNDEDSSNPNDVDTSFLSVSSGKIRINLELWIELELLEDDSISDYAVSDLTAFDYEEVISF